MKDPLSLFGYINCITWVFTAVFYLAVSCDMWPAPEPWYFADFLISLAMAFFSQKYFR